MGTDVLSGFENAFGSAKADVLVGDLLPNQLFGGVGNDVLRGGGGRDLLDGHRGKDAMAGGRGVDSLTGGPGKDTLRGNAGRDICYVEQDGGTRKSCENRDDPWAGRAVAEQALA
jgi:Ca2+-binding RTX toxin-like protein